MADAQASATELKSEDLARLALFRDVEPRLIGPMLTNCPVRALAPGEVLLSEGAPNSSLYILLEGQLSIRLDGSDAPVVAIVGPGESVGELSAIDHRGSSAWVVADRECRVLVVDEELLWVLVGSSHALAANLLALLVRRMRYSNDVITQYGHQIDVYRFHATVDALTGLFNRHWLNSMLPRQMERSRVSREPLALLLADIDQFKLYNDTHGHLAGDCALVAVAQAIRECLRPTDLAARYGGEEFLVLLPAADLENARTVAERVRRHVEDAPVAAPGGRSLPGVTLSIGIARLAEDSTAETLVDAADRALYRAKHEGRNRVVG